MQKPGIFRILEFSEPFHNCTLTHIKNPVEGPPTMYGMGHIRTLSIIINSETFRYIHILIRNIQRYWGTFRTLSNPCIFRTLPYSEFWQIWNPRCNSVTYSCHLGNWCTNLGTKVWAQKQFSVSFFFFQKNTLESRSMISQCN